MYCVIGTIVCQPQDKGGCRNWLRPTSTAPLVSIHTTQPLEVLCVDFQSLETPKGGCQYILAVTDNFTRYAIAIPTRNMTAKTTATAMFNEFIVPYEKSLGSGW